MADPGFLWSRIWKANRVPCRPDVQLEQRHKSSVLTPDFTLTLTTYGWSKSGTIQYQSHKLEKVCGDSVRWQETQFLSQVFQALYMVTLKLR